MRWTIERLLEQLGPQPINRLDRPQMIDTDVGCSWTYTYPQPLDVEATDAQRARALLALGSAFRGLGVLGRRSPRSGLHLFVRPGVPKLEFERPPNELDFMDLITRLARHADRYEEVQLFLWLLLWFENDLGMFELRAVPDTCFTYVKTDSDTGRLELNVFFTHGLFAPRIWDHDNRWIARLNQPILRHILGKLRQALPEWEISWWDNIGTHGDPSKVGPEGYIVPPPADDEPPPDGDYLGALSWFTVDEDEEEDP
ncbi:MAG: hypothetical protein ACLFU2_14100 [Opitutales bacterium]